METLRAYSLPPGFGFHPTDVELISHYLKKKLLGLEIEYDIIPEVDIYKHDPWDLPAKCNIPTKDTKWHFFVARDRKYPNGSRSNRATEAGYWKSTGMDRNIKSHNHVIGSKKTLVFHAGRPPHGKRTDWIMHEYYMDEKECKAKPDMTNVFVLCRITKRNGWAPEGEISTQIAGSENVDENERWIEELWNPDFAAVPTIGEIMSEPKISQAEVTSHAPKQEPINSPSLPNDLDDPELFLLADDIHNILQSEPQYLNSNVFWDFSRTVDPASIHETNADEEQNDFFTSLFVTEDMENHIESNHSTMVDSSIGNHASSFMHGNGKQEELLVSDTKYVDTGIQIRERCGKLSTEYQSHRNRLQISKLEKRNIGPARTFEIVSSDQHVDLGHHVSVDYVSPNSGTSLELMKTSVASAPVGTDVKEETISEKSSSGLNSSQPYNEIKEGSDSESITSKLGQILISDASIQKRRQAGPSNRGATGGNRGVCLFLCGSSSIGLNCLFLMGTATLVLYFLLLDMRCFLGYFACFGAI